MLFVGIKTVSWLELILLQINKSCSYTSNEQNTSEHWTLNIVILYYKTLTSVIDTEAYSELSKTSKMDIFWSH